MSTAAALTNPSGAGTQALSAALKRGEIGAFKAESDAAACLLPLLEALGWRGGVRQIVETLPHFANTLSLDDLRNVLANLGFRTVAKRVRPGDRLDRRLMPGLMVDQAGCLYVLKRIDADGRIQAFGGGSRGPALLQDGQLNGQLYLVAPDELVADAADRQKENWLRAAFRRFRPAAGKLLVQTFLLNVLALAVPLFIMAVYDQVIPSGSDRILLPLAIGLILAFSFEALIRYARAKLLAAVGGRLDYLIATSVFRQILLLPASLTETAPLGAQVARLREFDSLRDLFTGTLATIVLEMPFVLLFLAVIAALAGWLALIPLAMILLFAVIAAFVVPPLKRRVARASKTRAERHAFLVETVTNIRTIREAGVESVWRDRFREINARTGLAQFGSAQLSLFMQTLAQTIMMAAGLATVGFGVVAVLAGSLSVGGLIATMALVWRVLTPIHNLFLTLTRAEQIRAAVHQINQLMRMPTETVARPATAMARRWAGRISLNRVSFRYSASTEPALLGISFEAQPGELIAIMGSNGAGKSSVLRLVLGMYRPQAGQVALDGLDIRQIDPLEVRRAVALVPQSGHLFHGTLAQNLRLSNPMASEADLAQALRLAGLYDEIMALPEGLETRVGDQAVWQLNAGFRQRLSLARAYVRDAPVMLLDEPAQALDETGDTALMQALQQFHGQRTILMVSHRPSHVKLADKVLVLDRGQLVLSGTPDEIFSKLPGGIV
ncbi:MAG: peptidase domain-containing ABC transporter [Rhodothalassiaceae bacterium]